MIGSFITLSLWKVELQCFERQNSGRIQTNTLSRLQEPEVTIDGKEVETGENGVGKSDAQMEDVKKHEEDVQVMGVEEELKHIFPYARMCCYPQE